MKNLFLPIAIALLTNLVFAADYATGEDAFDEGDHETALKVWLPLAEQGDARAQHMIALMYRVGVGVPQNDKTAVKWYTFAAKQGDAAAMYQLGSIYEFGIVGLPQNEKAAVKWFTLAAEQGYVLAQYNLGNRYADGIGVPEDDKTAASWFTLAAEQGYALAQYNLGIMHAKGEGVPENYNTAVKWLTVAAEQGNASAQTALGLMYADDRGAPESDKTTVKWDTLTMEYVVWAIALFFLFSWPIVIWIKIERGEYYPRSMGIAVLWWIPEMWVVYQSSLSTYQLLWIMPTTFLVAFTLDTILLVRYSGRNHTFVIWLLVGMLVFPTLIFL